MPEFNENISLINDSGFTTIILDKQMERLTLGGGGQAASLKLFDEDVEIVRLQAALGNVLRVNNRDGAPTFMLNRNGVLNLGSNGRGGSLNLLPSTNVGNTISSSKSALKLDGDTANISLGGQGLDGGLLIRDTRGRVRFSLNAASMLETFSESDKLTCRLTSDGNLKLGSRGANGSVYLFPKNAINFLVPGTRAAIILDADASNLLVRGENRVEINGNSGRVNLHKGSKLTGTLGSDGDLKLGSRGINGAVYLFSKSAINFLAPGARAAIILDADASNLLVRGENRVEINGNTGGVNLHTGSKLTGTLGSEGNLNLGSNGADGDVLLFPKNASDFSVPNASIHLNADSGNIRIGGGSNNSGGDIKLQNGEGQTTVHLDGNAGDIILENADCAEDFEFENATLCEPGDVMVFNTAGKLTRCTQPCDTRVVGVYAGAGNLKPGLILGRDPEKINRAPIALIGRTNCKVDATNTEIIAGDLLTTSSRPGFAEKVISENIAPGCILGKAMKSLAGKTGVIPILVTLQ